MVKFGSHFLFYILSEINVNFDRSLGATPMVKFVSHFLCL